MCKTISKHRSVKGAEPIASYPGLRSAVHGVNCVIGPPGTCPELVNVAVVGSLGVTVGHERELEGSVTIPFERPRWQRTSRHRAVAP